MISAPDLTPVSTSPKTAKVAKSNNFLLFVIVPFIILLTGLVIITIYQNNQSKELKKSIEAMQAGYSQRLDTLEKPTKYVQEQVDKNKIQAVFLKGGEVCFGKIAHIDASTMTIENIYYLKDGTYNKNGTITGNDASLIKLGNELHKPEDKMIIERKNVNFWENLKANGDVTKAIADYEKKSQ